MISPDGVVTASSNIYLRGIVEYTFRVYGIPAPQGSKSPKGKGRMVESSENLPSWREDVRQAALTARGDRVPLNGALFLEMHFSVARPGGHFRPDGSLRPGAPPFPNTRPDLTKYQRATEDALASAGLIREDSRVVGHLSRKWYVDSHLNPYVMNAPGVYIVLCSLDPM